MTGQEAIWTLVYFTIIAVLVVGIVLIFDKVIF